ncbi:hypothetical protein HYPSUDRAFT_538606 [Hypholoma sublateritium FD-334 SS-4]|uniref:Uncharacterized protein n=1 Tax=Hypholoma sublateritium (strain FD-334 SS-4) TaxID=945553 RepID=A0A0D2PXX2_HYPSF|nr:hypothetical protein HYPSUDRAFT_538606 [Hypholoma sublateritium FD-334 SS-4]
MYHRLPPRLCSSCALSSAKRRGGCACIMPSHLPRGPLSVIRSEFHGCDLFHGGGTRRSDKDFRLSMEDKDKAFEVHTDLSSSVKLQISKVPRHSLFRTLMPRRAFGSPAERRTRQSRLCGTRFAELTQVFHPTPLFVPRINSFKPCRTLPRLFLFVFLSPAAPTRRRAPPLRPIHLQRRVKEESPPERSAARPSPSSACRPTATGAVRPRPARAEPPDYQEGSCKLRIPHRCAARSICSAA